MTTTPRSGTPRRIHITGASGSGTTTLGAAAAAALGVKHLDADDFAWAPTDPPFMQRYTPEERWAGFMAAIAGRHSASWRQCERSVAVSGQKPTARPAA